MKILILCGVFGKENAREVMGHARRAVEFSANTFQEKLIRGFRQCGADVQVLSAPFIGSWPDASDIRFFEGFSEPQTEYDYVPFCNIWGLRHFSRAVSLKRALGDFIALRDNEKLIVVYSAHTPFLAAAAYAKKRDSRIRLCLYAPDLPDYMNLSADRSRLYDIAKQVDIAAMARYLRHTDAFVLLTRQMRGRLPVGDKPCLIREGIIDEIPGAATVPQPWKYIVYTGKLDAKFGIPELLEAFSQIQEPEYRLVLCGRGDCDGAIAQAAEGDSRIIATGQLTPEEAVGWQQRAAVLVNPRQNSGEYTKYSFPSKNIEYLLTGKPVTAFLLDGMPECYRDFLYEADPGLPAAEALARAIRQAAEDPEEQTRRYRAFLDHAGSNLMADGIAGAIVRMCFGK